MKRIIRILDLGVGEGKDRGELDNVEKIEKVMLKKVRTETLSQIIIKSYKL